MVPIAAAWICVALLASCGDSAGGADAACGEACGDADAGRETPRDDAPLDDLGAGDDGADADDGAEVPAGECVRHDDCDDDDPCSDDLCEVDAGGVARCVHRPVPACVPSLVILDQTFDALDGNSLGAFAEGGGRWHTTAADGCPADVAFRFADGFDGYADESFPQGTGGWTTVEDAGASVTLVSDPAYGGSGKSLRILGTTTPGSYGQASHAFPRQSTGWVEYQLLAPGNTKEKWITLDEEADSRAYLYFAADGTIQFNEGGARTTLQAYEPDVWYRVRMAWDAAADTVDVTISGTPHPGLRVYRPIDRYVNRVRFRTASATGLSFNIDDVSASGGEAVRGGTGASLQLGWEGADCAVSARHAFPLKETGTIEFHVLAPDAATLHQVALDEGRSFVPPGGDVEPARRVYLLLAEDGRIKYHDGAEVRDLPTPASWVPGTWHHVRIRWSGRTDTFDVWIDDMTVPKGSGLATYAPITEGIDGIDFRLRAPYASGRFFVDDVRAEAFDVPVVVQGTDLHVGSAETNEALVSAAVREWNAQVRADVALVTGDLSNSGDAAQLERARDLLAPSNAPAHCVAGNHDDGTSPPGSLENYASAFGAPAYAFDYGPIRFTAVNTAGKPSGDNELLAEDLAWVDADLAAAATTGCGGGGCPVRIAYQHASPLAFPDGGYRVSPEANADAFVATLQSRGVLLDLAGHSHQCESIAWREPVHLVVSHPLAQSGGSYPTGYRVIAIDGGTWSQTYRTFADPLPLVQITWPPNRAEPCEDCGGGECPAAGAAGVDMGAGRGGGDLGGLVPIRAKAMPAFQRRFEAETDPAVLRSGSWSSYGGGTNGNLSSGAGLLADDDCGGTEELTFPFSGTGFVLLYSAGTNYGSFRVDIDGVEVGTVDGYAAGYSPQQAWSCLGRLADGPHALRVVQAGERNAASSGCAVLIDAIDVGAREPAVVEMGVDGGAWTPLDYDRNGLYRGVWDSRTVPNGVHTLTVRVPSGTAGVSTDTITVRVAN